MAQSKRGCDENFKVYDVRKLGANPTRAGQGRAL